MVGDEGRFLRDDHKVSIYCSSIRRYLTALITNRSYIQSFADKFRGKMLLDLVATVVDDYDFLWDQYYFPTATL